MKILAIDPGTIQSAMICWDGKKIIGFTKTENGFIRNQLRECERDCPLVIEEINPYKIGMTIRDTILWSGIFQEAWEHQFRKVYYLPRREVAKHLCGIGSGFNDSMIIAALADRFAYGQKNRGKGTKKNPGFFYGFKADIWQAFALAVTWWDKNNGDKKWI